VPANLTDSHTLLLLGGFAGAQALVVWFSVLIAHAYRERVLLLHAASVLLGMMALYGVVLPLPGLLGDRLPDAAILCMLAAASFVLRELVNHAGAMRRMRTALKVSGAALGVLALVGLASGWGLSFLGTAVFAAVVLPVLLRAWPQSQPWAWWLVAGIVGLLLAAMGVGAESLTVVNHSDELLAASLTLWASGAYLATVWRSRLFAETRVRVNARKVTDPLTGLSTQLIFADRVEAARALLRRYGHPSALLLVEIENLDALTREYGPEMAESALLVAASRVRQALGEADVAARISHRRIAVLAEGIALAEAMSLVGTRILVAGLKEPLPQAPAEFLQFRMVVATVPPAGLSAKLVLARLGVLLDEQVRAPTERRIVAVPAEEMLAA